MMELLLFIWMINELLSRNITFKTNITLVANMVTGIGSATGFIN